MKQNYLILPSNDILSFTHLNLTLCNALPFFDKMLQAAANVAPRGVYVCGNTSTATGLTVTLAKEAGSNEYSLEAGALVLGDQGEV